VTPTTPVTPNIGPTLLSALSVSSLEPFSRTVSEGSLTAPANLDALVGSISLPVADQTPGGATSSPQGDKFNEKPKEVTVQFKGIGGPDEGWIDVEVGRGLANYNSTEILRLKGVKRQVS
jgi:hypothetical protein